ncbi:TlpA family protein disulfide reductase [Aliarcobacter thereius]|uniref:TlpA family protein disulfide reductase n=1 Tax=Aliarcobacter thereius TaxID=544718 RepID=UPI0010FDD8B8|nr:TlpA disulfide reductase family protein [Aliarcobacter thereius]TLT07295.1 TlpA family protein disulfide reductase [Aliarcobacter thereius]
MKSLKYILIVFIVSLFVACDSGGSINSNSLAKNKINEIEAEFEPKSFVLTSSDNKKIEFSTTEIGADFKDFKDKKVVIIDIFATWCPPCIESLPMLKAIQEKNKDDLQIISVLFQDEKSVEEINDFIEEHKINYPITMGEENQALADELNVRRVPEMFLFSKSGKFVHKFVGKVPEDELEKYLKIAIEN